MTNKLVAFFSASGITKKAAEALAEVTMADIFEIKPEEPYTEADLNWRDKNSRSSVEMNNPSSRPKVASKLSNIDDYDIVFLGFPIWWYTAPSIINTFLESYDFSNKKIVLFATSGSSGLGKTKDDLEKVVSSSTKVINGRMLNGKLDKKEIANWINSLPL